MKNKPLILIVDDDPDILKVLKANLGLYEFDVITAESCKSAKKIFTEKIPDLILLDIMLPDGDGVEMCRKLRKSNSRIPVIMLTAKDKLSDKIMGLESGADDYIVKPFETLELVARIKACLRRSGTIHENCLKIAELFIDLPRRQVRKNDKEINLTQRQFDLLVFLVENRHRVLTRKEIKEHLWKEKELYSWSRVIDVHIRHLREKIEENLEKPSYILTMPGVGYKFREE